MKEFLKNKEGVHLMSSAAGGEYTICGYCFDDEEQILIHGELETTDSETVTCDNCIALIKYCNGVKYQEPTNEQ